MTWHFSRKNAIILRRDSVKKPLKIGGNHDKH